MEKYNKKYLISLSLILLSLIMMILGFCLKTYLGFLSIILVIFGLIILLLCVYIIQCYSEIENQNKNYINDIIMYKKGYTLKLRLPRTEIEDRLFREYADEEMIKELDSYLENNKNVKIFNDNYTDNTIKKLNRK